MAKVNANILSGEILREKKQFQLATSIESKRDNIINCLLLKIFKYFKQWPWLSTVRKIIPKKDFKSIYITKRHIELKNKASVDHKIIQEVISGIAFLQTLRKASLKVQCHPKLTT